MLHFVKPTIIIRKTKLWRRPQLQIIAQINLEYPNDASITQKHEKNKYQRRKEKRITNEKEERRTQSSQSVIKEA